MGDVRCGRCPPEAAGTVDAGREPGIAAALRDGAYAACPGCGRTAPGPELTWIDPARGQWIAAYPRAGLDAWRDHEAQALARFAASAPALRPRVAFGWAGLRELAVAAEAGLDDVRLELLKLLLMRGMDPPLPLRTELRLTAATADSLAIDVLDRDGRTVESLDVPREMIAGIESDPEGWAELRGQLSAGPFTDVLRLWRA